jgi:CheY-like chemotaxis protein
VSSSEPDPDLLASRIVETIREPLLVLDDVLDDPGGRIPVVILTSSEAEEDIEKSYDRYANAYVTKPVDLSELSKVVRAIDSFWFEVVRLPPEVD